MEPFLGSTAIASGALTRGVLRARYTAVLPNIYILKSAEPTLLVRAQAAWLWCGRSGVIAGRTAAGLYRNPWAVNSDPVEVIAPKSKHPPGVIVRNERISVDEITVRQSLPVTTAVRTALDLARHLDRDVAVEILDPFTADTGVTRDDIWRLTDRYPRARGIRTARATILEVDPGAQTPQETRVRLMLSDAGYRPTHSQIRVTDGYQEAMVAMGWPDLKIGVACDETQGYYRAEKAEFLQSQGWLTIHVLPRHTSGSVRYRVRTALWSRTRSRPTAPR